MSGQEDFALSVYPAEKDLLGHLRSEHRKHDGTVPIQLMRLSLDSQTVLEPVDEQPDHQLVHLDGSGKANSSRKINPYPYVRYNQR
jgi:hypothetical protein